MEKVKSSAEQNNFFFKIEFILFGSYKPALLEFSAEEWWYHCRAACFEGCVRAMLPGSLEVLPPNSWCNAMDLKI